MLSRSLRHEGGLGETRLALATCVVTGILLTALRATEGPQDREALLFTLVLFPAALYVAVNGYVALIVAFASGWGGWA